MNRLISKFTTWIQQARQTAAQLWQRQWTALQNSGVVYKIVGMAVLVLSGVVLIGVGLFSLLLLGFLFFVATLQWMFTRQPHFAPARAEEVIIDTTAVKTAVKRDSF